MSKNAVCRSAIGRKRRRKAEALRRGFVKRPDGSQTDHPAAMTAFRSKVVDASLLPYRCSMKIPTSVLSAVLGMSFGAAVTALARPASESGQATEPRRAVRVNTIQVSSDLNGQYLFFIRDSRSGGCWMAVGDGPEGPSKSVAAAPKEACE